MEKADLAGGIALALVGVLLIFVVIPLDTEEGMYFGLPPTFFPTLLSIGLTLLAIALATKAWFRLRAGGTLQQAPIRLRNLLMFAIAAALVVAGAVVIDFFGMIVGGPLLIAAFMLFLGERSVIRVLATATLPVAAVYLLATYVLRAPLP
ncbi:MULTISPECIES: tripartite tricarboxylate transporter TctB family protein [Thalassobaculum]|uniref:Tripartite tricarboxylate transporter TctB family protein n=1 Tax=Thalassobaculum litoreum DSM 18839 TaxID=1123362 RepID=A0A8G2EXF6_9PROT|nr:MULTISPECIES: tripartite tricarboxylate transporter TctB family protein [Thalassobaculum]SDG16698.1 Tripartite tricarboxylate transporter TctB family protein [Thalassobaculum litoreum DSM 18839]